MSTRAIVYLRVSSVGQQENTSFETQLAACKMRAEGLGARVVSVVQDVQSGGDYRSRVGLQKALNALESDEADVLIIYDMSRYSRDVEHQQLIRKRVQAAGKTLAFATLDLGKENNAEASMMFGVNGVFAEYERLKIRDRTVAGNRRRASEGKQPRNSLRPYGYEVVSKQMILQGRYTLEQWGTYHIIESEAEIVREIFNRFDSGESLRSIAEELNRRGVPTPRGGLLWVHTTVRGILTNPVHYGQAVYGRWQAQTDEARLEKGYNKRYAKRAPEAEQISIESPPIISYELWQRCQEKLKQNKILKAGRPGRRFLLTGLLVCPECGHRMRGCTALKQSGYRYYRCAGRLTPQARRHIAPCSHSEMHRADGIEREVLAQVRKITANAECWRGRLKPAKSRASEVELKNYQKELAETEKRLDALLEAQTRAILNGLDSSLYEAKLKETSTRRAELLAQIKSQPAGEPVSETPDEILSAFLEKIRSVLAEPATLPELVQAQHDVLAAIIEKITPEKAPAKMRVSIVWKHGL